METEDEEKKDATTKHQVWRILTKMRKLVRKSAYLTTLDKHPSAIVEPFFSNLCLYLEIEWYEPQVQRLHIGITYNICLCLSLCGNLFLGQNTIAVINCVPCLQMLSLCEKGLVCSAEHWQQDSSLEDHERPPSSKCAEPGFADFDGCLQMIIGRVGQMCRTRFC